MAPTARPVRETVQRRDLAVDAAAALDVDDGKRRVSSTSPAPRRPIAGRRRSVAVGVRRSAGCRTSIASPFK
jgi:hypothetical protein